MIPYSRSIRSGFTAAHTYIAHIWHYSPPPPLRCIIRTVFARILTGVWAPDFEYLLNSTNQSANLTDLKMIFFAV